MAGLTWFELDVDYHEDPKIKALCSRLRLATADAFPSRLYAYCYKHAVDRFPPESAADTIEDVCRWRGRKGVLFDGLFAVEVLERDAGMVVVHGVRARLGPHLAKREADAERQKRHRDRVAESIRRNGTVTRDVTRNGTRESRSNTDKDKDRDKNQETDRQPAAADQREDEPGPEPLVLVRSELAKRLGFDRMLGLGKNEDKVIASFERWITTVGEEATIDECERLAREKGVAPSHLSWWPGWLDTVSDAELRRAAQRGTA